MRVAIGLISFLFLLIASAAVPFTLTSPDLPAAKPIAETFAFNDAGCKGGNQSPALAWSSAPAGTRSFAITVFDPDEKVTGSGWWHWIVYDIPASTMRLERGSGMEKSKTLPAPARQGKSDLGTAAYHGPCPSPGESHRYVFTIYALSTDKLPVDPDATPAMVRFTLNEFILGQAVLQATYVH